ncbi:crossover junction endodeoxyribonuclease RuvC [Sutcliffiella cohnii]
MRFVGIDPSTKTGFVALDEHGQVLRAKELTGVGAIDPKRMITLIDEIIAHIKTDDVICIEGFGFASQQAIQLGGIGWGIRMALARRGFTYYEASPSQLKKFASGKGNTPKDQLAVHIYKNFGFEHNSDNVRDGYVLAQIAKSLKQGKTSRAYQNEVYEAIKNPKPKVKKKPRKKVN